MLGLSFLTLWGRIGQYFVKVFLNKTDLGIKEPSEVGGKNLQLGDESIKINGGAEARPERNRSGPCPGDQELVCQKGENSRDRLHRAQNTVLKK